jgi:hypothetical protein
MPQLVWRFVLSCSASPVDILEIQSGRIGRKFDNSNEHRDSWTTFRLDTVVVATICIRKAEAEGDYLPFRM